MLGILEGFTETLTAFNTDHIKLTQSFVHFAQSTRKETTIAIGIKEFNSAGLFTPDIEYLEYLESAHFFCKNKKSKDLPMPSWQVFLPLGT